MSLQGDLWAAALALFAAFIALGLYVCGRPPGALDATAAHVRGQHTALAVVFTESGRSKGLTIACLIALALFAVERWPIWIPFLMILSQLVSQMVVELIKLRYQRNRPDYWLVGLDAGHSYPSGHATTSVVFFAAWALLAAFTPLPHTVQYAVVALLALWALGVCWSRLALGAHYLTDVAGGVLFGGAWLCALIAVTHGLVHVP